MLKIKLFLTMDCNLSCTYCYEKKYRDNHLWNKIDYQLQDLVSMIKQRLSVLDDDEVLIEFYGGEPLLQYEQLKIIVDYLKEYMDGTKLSFAITTNGTLVTPEISEYLKKNEIKIYLSMDGSEQGTKNRIYRMGKCAFTDIMKGYRSLLEYENNITINVVVNSENYMDLIKNLQFLVNHSAKSFYIAIDFLDEGWLAISDETLEEFYQKIKKYCFDHPDVYMDLFEKKVFPLTQCTMEKTLSITPKGDVYPCTYFPTCYKEELSLGKVTGEINWSKLGEISKEIICENKNCKSYEGNCKIGCYGKNLTCTGSLYTPSEVICKHSRCSNSAISNYKLRMLRKRMYI